MTDRVVVMNCMKMSKGECYVEDRCIERETKRYGKFLQAGMQKEPGVEVNASRIQCSEGSEGRTVCITHSIVASLPTYKVGCCCASTVGIH